MAVIFGQYRGELLIYLSRKPVLFVYVNHRADAAGIRTWGSLFTRRWYVRPRGRIPSFTGMPWNHALLVNSDKRSVTLARKHINRARVYTRAMRSVCISKRGCKGHDLNHSGQPSTAWGGTGGVYLPKSLVAAAMITRQWPSPPLFDLLHVRLKMCISVMTMEEPSCLAQPQCHGKCIPVYSYKAHENFQGTTNGIKLTSHHVLGWQQHAGAVTWYPSSCMAKELQFGS